MMKIIDNKVDKLGDNLKDKIKKGADLEVCASIFSMYGYKYLKRELENVESFKFIFTDPAFIQKSNDDKMFREFEINANIREKSLFGSEFEVKLKNELNGQEIAKECASWIERKAEFKSNVSTNYIQRFINVKNTDNSQSSFINADKFDSAGLGYSKDNSIFSTIQEYDDYQNTKFYISSFNDLWNNQKELTNVTDDVIGYLNDLYRENSPEFIYYITLYNIFHEFLLDVSKDELPNEKTGFKESKIWNTLYDFQKDAVLGIINKLEKYNGCILADSVGLGKTFSALGVIKYYQERNKSILVMCPKKLSDNWNTYLKNYKDNILYEDRFNYDVLYHTDLGRKKGVSNNINLSKINWANYDLIVIDESHNFRNNNARKDRTTRYDFLMEKVIKSGVKTKVLMLSATPVNNRFNDLKNQLALAYEGHTDEIDENISFDKSIDTILKNAQTVFNNWTKLPIEERTSKSLLRSLSSNFDFFKLLDSVTIARSRRHIEKYYNLNEIGKFPTRLKPINYQPEITNIENFMSVKDIANELSRLSMCVYSPFVYILPNKISKYEKIYDIEVGGGRSILHQIDREKSLQILMRINLLKRLESSVESFRLTLNKIMNFIENTLKSIQNFESNNSYNEIDTENIDIEVEDEDIESFISENMNMIGNKVKIDLKDMDILGWKQDLVFDYKILKQLLYEMQKITPDKDLKLITLKNVIKNKIENPINKDNKKILIFSAFADTINYLYKNLSIDLKDKFNLDSAKITGSEINECTLPIDKNYNNLLINFSPISKHREIIEDKSIDRDIEILFATDCISEGQNLQDCDYLINYDIHWNPVRIIQRFGRIDRIGSQNNVIQLVNFWPNISLDDYINLKSRVESRMAISDITATGEDNVLTNESNDMEYRKEQLKKLKEEVVDLEDMNSGISITDLGLNDFRMDLLDYIKEHPDINKFPNGMHSVVKENPSIGIEKGVIFVLKNINNGINIDNMNQLHPFYLIYIKEDGTIISNHLNVKKTLDILRILSKGKSEPVKEAYTIFNNNTNDGSNMIKYSNLLNDVISSIINITEENDIDSLFRGGGTTMLKNDIKGLEDFELITFLVIV